MSVNLKKGQKIDLTKGNTGLKHIMVGLGWDEAKQKGLLGGLFGKKADFDCDASAILCGEDGKLKNIVYYGNLRLPDNSVIHMGDNLTGEGDGDDEQIIVDIEKLDPHITKIVFGVNIFEAAKRKQHFGMIENAYIRLVDIDKNSELCRFDLTEDYTGMEGMLVGEIYKKDREWKFGAIGQAVKNASYYSDLSDMYR